MSFTEEDQKATTEWTRREEQNQQAARDEEQRARVEEERHPTRRCPHRFFIAFSTLTALAAFNMALGQVLGLIFQESGPVQYVLRIYVILLCILALLVELEWTAFARESKILGYWITRGLFYAFIGLLGLEENDTAESKNSAHRDYNASLNYIKAVAWLMICCGALYCTMGLCCLQIVYNRYRKEYKERCEKAAGITQNDEQALVAP